MKYLSRKSRRHLFLATAALMLAGAANSHGSNFLGNSDFESPDATGGDVPANPNGGGNIGSGGSGDWVAVAGNTFFTQTHFLTGKQSGKMFGNVGLFQQTVPVSHDTDTFTAEVMMLNASNDPLKGSEGGFINIDFFDINGNQLATVFGSEEGSQLTSVSTQDVWTLEKVTAPGLPNTAYVQVDLVAGPFTNVAGAAGGAVFVDQGYFEEVGAAQTLATWSPTTGGTWANNTNWSGGVTPQNATDTASFSSSITGPATITLDGNRSVGTLNLASAKSYSITPGTGGTLTLFNGSNAAAINVTSGSHSISADIMLASPTTVTISNAGDALTLSGNVFGSGLTKAGAGTLSISRLRLPSVSVTAGTLKIIPDGTSSSTSVLGSLNISPGATLDLADNDLLIPYVGNVSPAGVIRGYLASAFNGGVWNGPGLASSAAHNDATFHTALGYGEATDLGITSFDGISPNSSAVIVKYTYYGDTNLDGKVDTADFQRFLTGLVNNGNSWENGDFTYDGKVDLGNDFNLFLVGYLAQGNALGDLVPIIVADAQLSSSEKAQMLSAVPEPSIIGAMAIAPLLSMRRRRR
jgi:hypothetical protein